MGIEPTSSAWKAEVLPLNYTRLILQILLPNHDSLYRHDSLFVRPATIAAPIRSFYSAYKNPDSLFS